MQTWTRTLVSLTLICYIAVSSIASVHAFPSSIKSATSVQSAVASDRYGGSTELDSGDMGSNCHGQAGNDTESKTIATCAIFCAAMSSMIIDHVKVDLSSNTLDSKVEFLFAEFQDYALALEPRPPK